jgi:hypothetical protein
MAAPAQGKGMDEVEQGTRDAAVRAVHAAQAALLARLARLDTSAARLKAKWERLERLAAALELVPSPDPTRLRDDEVQHATSRR